MSADRTAISIAIMLDANNSLLLCNSVEIPVNAGDK
jgi:hypothetical protein